MAEVSLKESSIHGAAGRPSQLKPGQKRFVFPIKTVLAGLLLIGLVAAFPLLISWTGSPEALEPAAIKHWIKSFGAGSIGASIAVMIMAALTILPAEIPAMANGMIFGPWTGGVITWVGAMIGANIAYGVGRIVGPDLIDRWIGKKRAEQFHQMVEANGTAVLLLARCIPVIPFFALNYLSGALGIRWWTFNWVTAIGILPLTIALATMGDQAMHMPWGLWISLLLVFIAGLLLLRSLMRRTRVGAQLMNQPRSTG